MGKQKYSKIQIMTNMVLMLGSIPFPKEGKGLDGHVYYSREMREAVRLSRMVVWSETDELMQENYLEFQNYINKLI